MIQKDLFSNDTIIEPELIEVKSYIRKKKKVGGKKSANPSKVTSKSPINRENLSKQSNTLLKYLLDNENATFLDAISMFIMSPHSRFAEISSWISKHKMVLCRENISIKRPDGSSMCCKRYWINEVDKPTIKLLLGI